MSGVLHWEYVLGISGNVWVAGGCGGSPWAALDQLGNQWKQPTGPQCCNRQGSLCHCCSNMFKKGQQQWGVWGATRRHMREQEDIQKETPEEMCKETCVRNAEGTCKGILLGVWLEMHSCKEVLHDREGISEGSWPMEKTTPGRGWSWTDCGPQRSPCQGGDVPKACWTIEETALVQGYLWWTMVHGRACVGKKGTNKKHKTVKENKHEAGSGGNKPLLTSTSCTTRWLTKGIGRACM